MAPFPTEAPFRLDQVTTAPLLMAGLFAAQIAAATGLSWAGLRARQRLWWVAAAALLALVAVFFTLASWGNSDTTKLSYAFAEPGFRQEGEPLWTLLAPLVTQLPYRMSAMQGLVAAGYAAAALLLARSWRAPAWGGWWALLLCCSPLLRNFLQNGVTRQALATLLLLPLFLWAGRMAPLSRSWIGLATLGSAMAHTTFPASAPLALLPRLPGVGAAAGVGWMGRTSRPRRAWFALLAMLAAALVLIGLALPTILEKLETYLHDDDYFNSYPVAAVVQRLQLAMALGVGLTCWTRRLGWRALLGCGITRQLMAFGLLQQLVQASVRAGWMPQITTRLADVVGLFLLVSFLGWLHRHRCHWAVLPALFVTLDYWLLERLLPSRWLSCGANDDFLCVPDRWPWQIRYPVHP